jgi:DNA-binding MarR family transcriptional regulator
MRKVTSRKQPRQDEIEKVANQIATTDFWLCVSFADTINRYIEITMEKDNLSRLQAVAMWSLILKGGKSTPTLLARMMFRSKHSMTKIIDNLEKEGLVVRDYTNKDRRVTYIKITSDGLEYVKQNFSKGNERAQKVMACLDITERKSLVNLTEKMRKKIATIINNL